MKLRKLLSVLLALTMLLCFTGCQFVEDTDDTEDEVVGGGLIQARDGEEVDDVEVEDPITDTAEEEEIYQLELADMSDYAPEEGTSFYALVISVSDNGLAVCGLNTTVNDVNHGGLFSVSLSDDAEILKGSGGISISDLTAGDIVYIVYNGEVMESYPAQISGATGVYYDTHMSRLAEIEYLLPEGYESFGEYFPDWDNFEY